MSLRERSLAFLSHNYHLYLTGVCLGNSIYFGLQGEIALVQGGFT